MNLAITALILLRMAMCPHPIGETFAGMADTDFGHYAGSYTATLPANMPSNANSQLDRQLVPDGVRARITGSSRYVLVCGTAPGLHGPSGGVEEIEIGGQRLTCGELNRLVRERARIVKALEEAAEFVQPQTMWPLISYDDGVGHIGTEANRLRVQADALRAQADRLERQDAAAALIREVLAALKPPKGPGSQ